MPNNTAARRIDVNGIVQGVGFRPFVYNLARQYDLKGEVANTAAGVSILIEGPRESIRAFESDLAEKCPPLAHVVEITGRSESVQPYAEFQIVKSREQARMSTLISPDVSICDDCLRELFDPGDRRYLYPFINCTNCGPRYTIIDDIPYDRPKTSMRHFKMCAACQAEYDDPTNRRFHAQPNACEQCGPHVSLHDHRRKPITTDNPIKAAADCIRQGRIVAVKGLGGYHLVVDALNREAVLRLRKRKLREEKPFAIMSADLNGIREYARVRPEEETLLTSIQRPIVLLQKKNPSPISEAVAPGNKYWGVMLPYTPLHYLLLKQGFSALVMTSANLSEEPIAIDNGDAFKRLVDIADYFLTHDRDIYLRSDDSILKHTAGHKRYIRRSRGYVPIPIFLNQTGPAILACGAELKNTICLTKGDKAFLSQHIGDLENMMTLDFFKLTVAHLQRILEIQPETIACDMHPDYLSTQFAKEQANIRLIEVQHHHAHIVSCMAEHRLEGAVIGLAFDGTGYGPDGTIWGGEVLVAEAKRFERVAHLDEVPMPGSSTAIKQPWRMALSYLLATFGDNLPDLGLPLLKQIEAQKINIIVEMMEKGVNCPQTSSLGRLFDAVAAIAGIRQRVNFEGQAAMELEMLAGGHSDSIYDIQWTSQAPIKILPQTIIRGVVQDIQNGKSPAEISDKFHQTLIALFTEICALIRDRHDLNRVVLSGGCFQNSLLLRGLIGQLEAHNFEVYAHRQVPANDGGIALGQALIAAAIAEQ
ncbi:MAG: carbamoyltransferase HypF [Deltaproteobacteria bacterium]|jgi:hydrogenase maturation protein HypF|nr:carbamoyltransferase HypF [Deltaproteobacteria bacterium]